MQIGIVALFIAFVLATTIEIPNSLKNGVFKLRIPAWNEILEGDLYDFSKKPSSAAFANLAGQMHAFENVLLDYTIFHGAKAESHHVDENLEAWSKYSEEFHVYLTELLNNVSMFSKTQLSPAQFEALLHKVTTGPIRLTAEATEEIRILMKNSPDDIRDFFASKSEFFLNWELYVHVDRDSEDIAKILAFKIDVLDLFDHKINAALVKLEWPLHPELIAKIASETAFLQRALKTVSRRKFKAALAVAAIVGVSGALHVASQNGVFQRHWKKLSEHIGLTDPLKNAGNVIEPVVQAFPDDSGKLETKSITSSIENVVELKGNQLEPLIIEDAMPAKI